MDIKQEVPTDNFEWLTNAIKQEDAEILSTDIDTNFSDFVCDSDGPNGSQVEKPSSIQNFIVTVDETNAKNYCFSKLSKKLYCNFNVPCALRFQFVGHLPSDCNLKVYVQFIEPQHIEEKVDRCAYHCSENLPSNNGFPYPDHFLRSENRHAKYGSEERMNFVSVPFLSNGENYEQMHLFKFMCLSSCPGGINRRLINVVFCIENNNGNLIAQKNLHLKVCKCPLRDKLKDEQKYNEETSQVSGIGKVTKDKVYVLKTTNLNHYEFLKETLRSLEKRYPNEEHRKKRKLK